MKSIVLAVALIACTTLSSLTPTAPTGKSFVVKVKQHGIEVSVKDHEVTLEKKPFDLVFEFGGPNGLLVNASFKSETFDKAKTGEHLNSLKGFEETGMAEGLKNADMDMIIADSAPSYWFYESKEENRFNKVSIKGKTITCTRTIQSFFDRDSEKENKVVEIADVPGSLYLTFIDSKTDKDFNRIESGRDCLKINWK